MEFFKNGCVKLGGPHFIGFYLFICLSELWIKTRYSYKWGRSIMFRWRGTAAREHRIVSRHCVPGKTVGLKLLKLFRELIVGGTNFSSKLEKEIHSKKKEMEKIQLRNKVTVFIETSRYWEKFSSKQVHIEENENWKISSELSKKERNERKMMTSKK